MCTMRMEGFEFVYFSKMHIIEKQLYHELVHTFLKDLSKEYRDFESWYQGLFIFNDICPDREIVICRNSFEIAGVTILKKTGSEQKICTLRVLPRYQNLGIGKQLVKLSLEWLENDKPLITVHATKLLQFYPLFHYFNFKLEQQNWSYYSLFNLELAYNGELPTRHIWSREELLPALQQLRWMEYEHMSYERNKLYEVIITH